MSVVFTYPAKEQQPDCVALDSEGDTAILVADTGYSNHHRWTIAGGRLPKRLTYGRIDDESETDLDEADDALLCYLEEGTMLYVFLVDTGTMLHLDMNLALDTVAHLKQSIQHQYRIPEEKQVLLISGGESLDPNTRVCSYSAGTDTNPIYLFSKSTIESGDPPSPSKEVGSDTDMKEQVESSLDMPPVYTTVVARAQLAQDFYEQARTLIKDCEELVHDQHLQQQGWAAVVANLEDITQSFRARATRFEESYNSYLNARAGSLQLLQNFSQDLSLLAKIPVLPALVSDDETAPGVPQLEALGQRQQSDEGSDDVFSDERGESGGSSSGSSSAMHRSLLHWISSKDNQSSLEQVAEICYRGLEQFDSHTFDVVRADVSAALEAANSNTMKEVKGLEDRLFGLEQLMFEMKRFVSEQGDQAQAFLQNQNRAGNLGDQSVLPDLCASHRKQLLVMLKNHQRMRDIRRRCARAKEELSTNLHTRLRWIMYVERNMCDVDSKLVIYHENLKRLRCHLEVIQQIHLAPKIYLAAVAEVVRRKKYSQAFMQWASALAQQSLELHTKEVLVRRAFYSQLSNHFLQTLFRGMEDFPPPFAAQAPSPFDVRLPSVSPEDVEQLRQLLPDLAVHLQTKEFNPVPHLIKSCMLDLCTSLKTAADKEAQAVAGAGDADATGPCDPPATSGKVEPVLGSVTNMAVETTVMGKGEDDSETRDIESETETEEFEKVDGLAVVEEQRTSDAASDLANVCSTKKDEDSDEPGISEAKQRRVDNGDSVNMMPSTLRPCDALVSEDVLLAKTVSDRIEGDDMYDDELLSVAPFCTMLQPQPERLFLSTSDAAYTSSVTRAMTRAHSDGEIPPRTVMPCTTESSASHDAVTPCRRRPSPDDVSSSSVVMATSQDFVTAEFYIDESMPSSYTESNGTTGHRSVGAGLVSGTSGSSGIGGTGTGNHYYSPTVKSHHVIIAEMQRHLEEKNATITTLQEELTQQQSRLHLLEGKLQALRSLDKEKTGKLQEEITALRKEVAEQRDDLMRYISHVSTGLLSALGIVDVNIDHQRAEAVESALSQARQEHLKILEDIQQKYDLECEKRLQACREATMYQEELIRVTRLAETTRSELERQAEEERCNLLQTHKEEVQRLALEHELELDNVREEMKVELKAKDGEIRDLQEAKADLESQVQLLTKELALLEENLMQKMRADKDEAIRDALRNAAIEAELAWQKELERLKSEFDERMMRACDDLRTRLSEEAASDLRRELESQRVMIDEEKEAALQDVVQNLSSDAQNAREALERHHRDDVIALEARLRQEHAVDKELALRELREELTHQHRSEVDSLRSRFRMAISTANVSVSTSSPPTPSSLSPTLPSSPPLDVNQGSAVDSTLEMVRRCDHEELLSHARATEREQTLAEAECRYQEELQQALQGLRASLLAEKQVTFNEAVNRVTAEKDRSIEELRTKERELLAQLDDNKLLVQKLLLDKELAQRKEDFVQLHDENEASRQQISRLEAKLVEANQTIEILLAGRSESLAVSVAPVCESAGGLVTGVADQGSREKIWQLENTLKGAEEEVGRLQGRLMELSVTSSTAALIQQDKVSVLTCNVGDIVLLCYDDAHENYLVFLVCPIYHFLHLDCLEVLGLKTVPGEAKKPWVLAEVTDKEYCQAKKSQNRYRVALGTKFYRVKAKPWDKVPPQLRTMESSGSSAMTTSTQSSTSTPTHRPSNTTSASRPSTPLTPPSVHQPPPTITSSTSDPLTVSIAPLQDSADSR